MDHRLTSNNRRLFNREFKREQVSRLLRGEITARELARELDVQPKQIYAWAARVRAEDAAGASGVLPPTNTVEIQRMRERIEELERLVLAMTMERYTFTAAGGATTVARTQSRLTR